MAKKINVDKSTFIESDLENGVKYITCGLMNLLHDLNEGLIEEFELDARLTPFFTQGMIKARWLPINYNLWRTPKGIGIKYEERNGKIFLTKTTIRFHVTRKEI